MSSYFGLDLGASSIKVCSAQMAGAKFRLNALGLTQNPIGSLDFSNQENKRHLGDALKNLLKDAGIKDRRVVVSVPETQVYSRVVQIPLMSEAELSSAIQWEAEQFVPVPIEEVEMDYSVVYRPKNASEGDKMLVFLVASRKQYLQSFVDFLVEVGLEPIAVESEMVALSRAFQGLSQQGVSLVMHMGALSTSYSILSQGNLVFTHSIPTGGVAITRSLSQSLSLPLAQAEQYKRTYGLSSSQLEGKVRQSILTVFQNIINEARKAMEYYSSTYGLQINRVILSGGGAYMPEITGHLSSEFQGMEVIIGDPFMATKDGRVSLPEERAVYGVAVGLALRNT